MTKLSRAPQGAWLVAALLLAMAGAGCASRACPAIAAAPFATVEVTEARAATLGTLHGKACQDGTCHEKELELMDGSAPGSKVGHIDLGVLTESPIDITVSGTDRAGSSIGPYRVTLTPKANYPFGQECGKFLSAVAVLDEHGLSPKA